MINIWGEKTCKGTGRRRNLLLASFGLSDGLHFQNITPAMLLFHDNRSYIQSQSPSLAETAPTVLVSKIPASARQCPVPKGLSLSPTGPSSRFGDTKQWLILRSLSFSCSAPPLHVSVLIIHTSSLRSFCPTGGSCFPQLLQSMKSWSIFYWSFSYLINKFISSLQWFLINRLCPNNWWGLSLNWTLAGWEIGTRRGILWHCLGCVLRVELSAELLNDGKYKQSMVCSDIITD